ncbi:MAG: GAF domain-containing protein, partial [Halothiobacillus sp.]
MNKRLIRTNFSRNIWLIFVLYGLLAAAFVVYVDAEKTISQANDQRLQSLQLADELRQSSNDLTRMARAYTITGRPVFKQIYQEILAIRDGKIPHPVNDGDIFWDLFLGDEPGKSQEISAPLPPAPLPPAALLDRMRAARFTPQELNLLTQSKQESDALTALEYRAMAMIDQGANTDPSLKLRAIELLQNPAYYHAKAGIMRPIHEATELVLARTTQRVQAAEQTALQLRWMFIALGIALILLWLHTYDILERLLGGNLDSIYHTISRIGQGDFKTTIPINTSQKNSVLDWLSQTQNRLAALDEIRQAHETKINRMTQLYAALSQCNQAIVRCTNREELFAQICLDAVRFGGMKMAWIGEVEPETGQVRVVSAYGAGIEYLEGIDISLDPNKPSGQGPTGIALRTDTAYWCQDFIHDPRVAAWRERGAQVGWKSSAALPLHQDEQVVGVFSLYSDERNAFDEPTQQLLTEMAMDISFALHNFAREAERAKT